MRTLSLLLALAAGAVLSVPVGRADEPKPAPKFEVEVLKDIAYWDSKDADPAKNKLDLYLPKGKKDFPVLFFVHGGAWRGGDRANFSRLGRTFASLGIGTVSVGYRLSPKVKHPAHIQDVARAFAWVHQNIAKHGGRPDLIFISGHSAGGHLVALLASDESYLKAEKLSLKDIKGAIPISGVFQVGTWMKDIFGDDAEVCRKASPLTHAAAGLPPFLILYAENDLGNLGRQAKQMNEALKKAKADSDAVEFKGRNHGSIVGRIAADDDDPVKAAMLQFIAKHSKPNPKPDKAEPKP